MTTTTATQTLDIIGHLYNLDTALHEGGDKAISVYETERLLTDYSNGPDAYLTIMLAAEY